MNQTQGIKFNCIKIPPTGLYGCIVICNDFLVFIGPNNYKCGLNNVLNCFEVSYQCDKKGLDGCRKKRL